MIALISFKNDMVLTREEADGLKLKYEECSRVGYRDGKLQKMHTSDHYRDELDEVDGKYYKDGKEIQLYYLYERPSEHKDWVYISSQNHLVDLNWFALNCKYAFYIERCVRAEEPTIENIYTLLDTIEQKAARIDRTIDMMSQQTLNQRTNVHVGGGLIATYNELCLKEDCCTDALQVELNNGWRVIAVCVQPDQRRPDYILGRYNPMLEVRESEGAKR